METQNVHQNTENTQQPEIIKIIRKNRPLIPASFAAILILFLFSFCDFSCGGQKLVSIKGIDFVMGKNIPTPSISGDKNNSQKLPPNPYAIIAVASALTGLVIFLIGNKKESILGMIVGTAGSLSLLVLHYIVTSKVETELQGQVQVDFQIAYWLSTLLFIVSAIFSYVRKDIEQNSKIDFPFLKKLHPVKLGIVVFIVVASFIGYHFYSNYKLKNDRIMVINEMFTSSGFTIKSIFISNIRNDINGIDEYEFSCSITNESKYPLYINAEPGKNIVTKIPPHCEYDINLAKAYFKTDEAYFAKSDINYDVSDGYIKKYAIEGEWEFDTSNDSYNVFNQIQIFNDGLYLNIPSDMSDIGYESYRAEIKNFPSEQVFRINYDFSCCDAPRGSMYRKIELQMDDDFKKLILRCDNFNGKEYVAYFKRKAN